MMKRTKLLVQLAALGLCPLLLAACSSPGEPAGGADSPKGGSAGSTNTSLAGTAGSPSPAGGGSLAAGGVTGGGGASGGMPAAAGSAGAGGSGGASNVPMGPFTCTQYLGAMLTSEWWDAGFESAGPDNAKWQIKWHHHGNISHYRDPNSPFWSNVGDPNNDAEGSPILSPCAANSAAPDRFVYYAIDWDMLTEQAWVEGLNEVVANIKVKYPSVKWVDLTTMVRCPNNQMCNPGAAYGPGANDNGALQDCYVPPFADAAIQKVIAAQPNFVGLGPQPQMAECNPAHNGAHMTPAANQQAAQDIAAFYVLHP